LEGDPMRLVLVAMLSVLSLLPLGLRAAAAKPDIVVILLDDARAGDIEQAMPQTQALLADGTWFPNFILTTPQCCPSRATLLTGLYAHNHGARSNKIG
jgi:arylsulfatase A-like enzyme